MAMPTYLNEIDSSASPQNDGSQSIQGDREILRVNPQNDAFRHTEQSEVSKSIQGDGKILRHFVPLNDVLPTAGAMEDFETVLIPNDGDSGVSQQLVTEFTPNSGDIGISQELETGFTPTPVENRANATSSLTIKDADGAKPQTLAAGDKLNVTYVYEEKTFNYTIEAKSAQNVTLQTKDGYFTVVGDNLAVQTGDEQYSYVALIGTTNSLQIGTNGKTYNANSIAYNSAEGGHSIYTWGDDPEPEADLTLGRAGSSAVTSEVLSSGSLPLTKGEEKVVCLKNPFTGKDYTYTVKIRDDVESNSGYYQNETPYFEFMANGRLLIKANYVDIKAADGQVDDIILIGNYNNLDTGDRDDIIRVGFAHDVRTKDFAYQKKATQVDEYGNSASYTSYASGRGRCVEYTTDSKQWAFCNIGNHIKSGSGSDHVTMLLYMYDNVATVDMGENDNDFDTFMTTNGGASTHTENYSYFNSKMSQLNNLKGADIARSAWEDVGGLDNIDGWGGQAGGGGCVTLSFINSLSKGKNNLNLSDYVDITNNGDGSYDVTFKNYKPAAGKSNTVTVSPDTTTFSVTDNSYIFSFGDLDYKLLLIAIAKIASDSNPDWKTDTDIQKVINRLGLLGYIGNRQRRLLANLFFGNTNSVCQVSLGNETEFKNLVSHYIAENGEISNLILDTCNTEDYSIGRCSQHAYTLRTVQQNPETEEWYVELINPWDDRDCVRYSLKYLLDLHGQVDSQGYTNVYFYFYGHSEAQINAFKSKAFEG